MRKKIIILSFLIVFFFFFIVIIVAVASMLATATLCDAGISNEKNEEQAAAKVFTLDHFDISGKKEGNFYILSFLFDGWEIKDIKIHVDQKEVKVTVGMPVISGKDREELAYKYFISKGFTSEGAAGLIANIVVESGNTWKGNLEENYEEGYKGEEVINQGYGLCQWTNTEYNENVSWRRKNVINYVKEKGIDPSKDSDKLFMAELEYAITEPGYAEIVNNVKYQKSASKAAEIWVREWEKPIDIENNVIKRSKAAEEILNNYKNVTVYDEDGTKKKDVELSIKLEKEDGIIFFEGTLDGTDIAGNFEINDDKVTGNGDYGTGATAIGSIGNPYGTEKFTCTSVALKRRYCQYHGWEIHGGWDLCTGGIGTSIYSISDGVIEYAGPGGDFGPHFVVVKTGDMYIYYGHMSEHYLNTGDPVKKGQKIGDQGSEGTSTGAHLHLEFRNGSRDEGAKTANIKDMQPLLMRWCENYNDIESEFGEIEK